MHTFPHFKFSQTQRQQQTEMQKKQHIHRHIGNTGTDTDNRGNNRIQRPQQPMMATQDKIVKVVMIKSERRQLDSTGTMSHGWVFLQQQWMHSVSILRMGGKENLLDAAALWWW